MADDQIKVLMLPKWYPHKFNPLNGNFVENHIKAIEKVCNTAVLFVHSDAGLKSNYKLEESITEGVKVLRVYFKSPPKNNPFSALLWIKRYWKSHQYGLKHLEKNWGSPDLCHVHVLTRTAFFAYYLKVKKSIPYIISEHWSGYLPERKAFKGSVKKLATRFISKRAKAITTVSKNLRNGMQQNGIKGDYHIVPNVVDTATFTPSITENQGYKRIIHVSSLSDKPKQTGKIIKAISLVSKERNDFELHIYGDGPEGDKQREYAKEQAVKDKVVFFHGNVKPSVLADELKRGSFLLLYSIFENQPCVILEAFSAGLPVLSSRVGGIPEILNEKRGKLVDAYDTESLIKGIHDMLDNSEKYSKEHLHGYIEEYFSPDIVAKKFLSLYKSCLKK